MRIQIPGIIPAALLIAAVAFVAVNWPGEPLAYMAVLAAVALLKSLSVQLPTEIEKWIEQTIATMRQAQPPAAAGGPPAGASPTPPAATILAAAPRRGKMARLFFG